MAHWQTASPPPAPIECTYRLRHHAGGYRWTLARGIPLLEADGRLRAWIGMNTDIDPQRQAEARLRALNASLTDRVEERTRERDRMWLLSQDLMLVAGFDGQVESVNPAWTKRARLGPRRHARHPLPRPGASGGPRRHAAGNLPRSARASPPIASRTATATRTAAGAGSPGRRSGGGADPRRRPRRHRREGRRRGAARAPRSSCARRRRWRRSASSPAASRMTSTTCSPASSARWTLLQRRVARRPRRRDRPLRRGRDRLGPARRGADPAAAGLRPAPAAGPAARSMSPSLIRSMEELLRRTDRRGHRPRDRDPARAAADARATPTSSRTPSSTWRSTPATRCPRAAGWSIHARHQPRLGQRATR